MPMAADAPIGIFDSGIGGLSVLRHVRVALPREKLLYFADSGYAPYGDKEEQQIVERSLAVAGFLVEAGIKALVVACNTATAAAIQAIRRRWPQLIVVGIEPGLKPAAAQSKSRIVGVLATRSTLASKRFIQLREQIAATSEVRFLSQACVGLVDQIEKGELSSAVTARLVDQYVAPLIAQGADTLVLGCTHYPFVGALIESAARHAGLASPVIIDTGEAVTRQLQRLLEERALCNNNTPPEALRAYTTASASTLETIFASLLKIRPDIVQIT
ncbi:glutamate racemase [Herbaspirillum rhizosphaerae]|uniref:glutamate racemase n=1 Tax=Herbaspirillum rhizosphaerae TaxID=346179 RepID=UPI000A589813|nr:glutamate racemase [Herbaspirillum rhizosphaerae]